jgi:DNA processing protein
LERIPRVGPLTIARLIKAFGTPEAAMRADVAQIVRLAGLSEKIARSISEFKVPTDEILKDMATLERLGARVITRWDPDYPANLQQIYDPPALLFVRGDFRPEDDRAVAVVGSRNATAYGLDMAESITRDLIGAEITIVSGLARGVDTAAHRTALKHGGRTIGVLGCGLDIDYPRENRSLVTEMLGSGAVISEFRPRVAPLATNFYRRNRIVSGLAKGVVVIEASRTSGSLITAAHALDQNRDVLAVPGNVMNSRSKGPHHLIKQGAALVESGEDVVRALFELSAGPVQKSIFEPPAKESGPRPATWKAVLDALDPDPLPIDSLCETLKMDAGQLSGILLELELEGLIRQHPGKMFSRLLGL